MGSVDRKLNICKLSKQVLQSDLRVGNYVGVLLKAFKQGQRGRGQRGRGAEGRGHHTLYSVL